MFGFNKKFDATAITTEVLEDTALLIDVRRNDEWNNGHARNAVHVSVDRIMNGELPTKDVSKKLYLYCASGSRASMATSFLQQKGYMAENLGGLRDWKAAGGAVES